MAGIRSIGWCVPKGRRGAEDLSAEFGVPLTTLQAFGLRSRAEPAEQDHPSTLGARSVRYALEACGLTIDDVDLLIFAGMTRDYPSPWVGAFGILHELRATRTGGFDLVNRCASVHDALWIAAKLVESGSHRRVVVCCADRFDHLFDITTSARVASDLAYSGGGAAAVVDDAAENAIVAYSGYTNPDLSVHLQNIPVYGGTRRQLDDESFSSGLHRRRSTINLFQAKSVLDYLRAADAHNIPSVSRAAGFAEIDFVIASPLDMRAQLTSLEELGIDRKKTFFLLPVLGHMGPADSLINLGAVTSTRSIGTRIVMSTRTVTYSNALALSTSGPNIGIRVKGSGITQQEIDACIVA